MREKPILFSGEMVRAILAGTKTQTRRLVDLKHLKVRLPRTVRAEFGCDPLKAAPGIHPARMNPLGAMSAVTDSGSLGLKPGEFDLVTPLGSGDTHWRRHESGGIARGAWVVGIDEPCRLWVRETWWSPISAKMDRESVCYRSDGEAPSYMGKCWRPSIHMPRWAARIFLRVTSVRLERLQDISAKDIIAEGVEAFDGAFSDEEHCACAKRIGACIDDWRPTFSLLWDRINGKRSSWDSNPWVWVIGFEREKQHA